MSLEDFKDRSGNWVQQVKYKGKVFRTRLGDAYGGIINRYKVGGYIQNNKPTYVGCTNGFSSFNEFAGWAVLQVGYGCDGYALDKDILVKGNKVYSKDTCAFVPVALNNLLLSGKRRKHKLPTGVKLIEDSNKYEAFVNIRSKRTYLGSFSDPHLAFLAYKEAKERHIKIIAEEYKSGIDVRVYEALLNYEVSIDD